MLQRIWRGYPSENVNFELIDQFEEVTDKDAALYTRKLAREEGIFAGNSLVPQ